MKRNLFTVTLRLALLAAVVITCTSSGFGPEGFKKQTWTKQELVSWYAKYRPGNERLQRFSYRGSDAGYHYFMTRPIDSYLMLRVARTELHIADERPLGRASSGPLYHYQVDPLQDFKKVPSP